MSDERGTVLDTQQIEAMRRRGLNNAEIAEITGTTRQAVSSRFLRAGMTGQKGRSLEFPFTVAKVQQQTPYKRLRDFAEAVMYGTEGWSENKLRRMRSWIAMLNLNGWVVEFDPELPPVKGVSATGGWRYVARDERDGDSLIRENQHTNLTEKGRQIYRMPDEVP